MKLTTPLIKNLSIVIVGSFNPPIFNPSWLALKGLIRESDSENADIRIIHPEISHFFLSFVEVNATSNKVIFSSVNEADFDLVKDLVISVFDFLRETPIDGIGLNHVSHINLESAKNFNNFGNWLAPHNIWEDSLENPKLLELKILEPFSESNPVRNIITVGISDNIKPYGVSVQVNYHLEFAKTPGLLPSEAINEHWQKSLDKSQETINNLISKFNG